MLLSNISNIDFNPYAVKRENNISVKKSFTCIYNMFQFLSKMNVNHCHLHQDIQDSTELFPLISERLFLAFVLTSNQPYIYIL